MGTIKQTRHDAIVGFRASQSVPLVAAAGCLSALLLPGCSHHKQQPPVTNAAYQQALADAKKTGIIVSAKDLAQPMPPASQNAAPVYLKLMAQPVSKEDIAAELQSRPLGHIHTSSQLAAAASLLKRRSDVLALTHQAAIRPQCVFERNWAAHDPASIPFPELGKIRECARFLATESMLMAYQGNGVAAVKNESLSFRLARHAGNDRTLISYLVETAIDAITFAALQKIMVISQGDPIVAKAVTDSIDRDWRPAPLQPFIRDEAAMAFSEVEFMRWQIKQGGPGAQVIPSNADEIMNANGLYVLTSMQKILPAADLPYPEAFARENTIQMQIDKDMARPRALLPSDIRWNVSHMVAYIFLPDPTKLGIVHKQVNLLRCAKLRSHFASRCRISLRD